MQEITFIWNILKKWILRLIQFHQIGLKYEVCIFYLYL